MRTFQLSKPIYIKSGFTIVGPKEGDGNFADKFDIVLKNDVWCEKSFEKCESKMHRDAVSGAIKKAAFSNSACTTVSDSFVSAKSWQGPSIAKDISTS